MRRWAGRAVLAAALALAAATPVGAASPDTEVTVKGGGWGHGVGMPQYGARGMADEGSSYADILSYFYVGTGLGALADAAVAPPAELKVGINEAFPSVSFSAANGDVEVCLPGEEAGACSHTATPGEAWAVAHSAAGCTLTRSAARVYGPGGCDISLEWDNQPEVRVAFPALGRTFARGRVRFRGQCDQLDPMYRCGAAGLHVTVELGIEDYLLGIGEMPVSWHGQALRAQVVAARTYAAYFAAARTVKYALNGGLRPDCSCHLLWSTSDQVYRGWHGLNEGDATHGAAWRGAVEDTAGEVVVHPAGSNLLAQTFYFSNSGGATENVSDVWRSDQELYPYLTTRPDPWSGAYAKEDCAVSKLRWCVKTTAGVIAAALGLDSLTSINIRERYESGSPSVIVVSGVRSGKVTESPYTGSELRAKLREAGLDVHSHHIYSISGLSLPERFAGADRYATAAAASKAVFRNGSDVVYVATGLDYPDALAGGAAAAVESAPVLLVARDTVPGATRDEIRRLSPSKIVVLGGEGVVSSQVAALLSSHVPNATVERRWGKTRFETAVEVSKSVFAGEVGTAYVTGGLSFADAMVAVPAAVRDGAPLLLVHPEVIPTAVKGELRRLKPVRIVVVGGEGVVPPGVFAALSGYTSDVTRIGGSDRYAVGAAVAAEFAADTETVYVAVGADYPDALTGGAIAGKAPGPMFLVRTDRIPDAVKSHLNRIRPRRAVILGGAGVVSKAVEKGLTVYLE